MSLNLKQTIQDLKESDLDSILQFYEEGANAPTFVRNQEFLKHFIEYPCMAKRIFIYRNQYSVEAFAILAVVNNDDLIEGRIIELRTANPAAFRSVIQSIQEYCQDNKVDRILLRPPVELNPRKILRGWVEVNSSSMMTRPVHLLPIIELLTRKKTITNHFTGRTFIFDLINEIISIQIDKDKIEVKQIDRIPDRDSGMIVKMSPQTFINLVFNQVNPYVYYMRRKIVIYGIRDVPLIFKLLSCLKTKSPWNISLVDEV